MRLPAYEDLSKEQDAVLTLDLDGTYLVSGAPGTGKTVVSLYRASRIRREGHQVRMIMYSKLLSTYAAVTDGNTASIANDICTYHSWFSRLYWKNYSSAVPHLPDSRFDYDWMTILTHMGTKPPPALNEYVLVDEGQDLPQMLYLISRTFLTPNLTIFADENQRITKDRCLLSDITSAAQIPPDRQFTLKRNYRNTLEIHNLACWFHRGSPSGLAAAPDRRGNTPVMLSARSLTEQIEYIRNYERVHASRSIGVLVSRRSELHTIRAALIKGGTINPVQAYQRGKWMPEFNQPGITLLCYPSAKGLEFDAVFLPSMEQLDQTAVEQSDKMMNMYVMVTRAREELFLMHAGSSCALMNALPDTLVRKVSLQHD